MFSAVQHPTTLRWRDILDWAAEASATGPPIRARVLSRAIGVMLGHELTLNPFYTTSSYQELESLSIDDKIGVLKQPEMRARILSALLVAYQGGIALFC